MNPRTGPAEFVDVWTAVWWVLKNGTLVVVSILKDIFYRDGKARRRK